MIIIISIILTFIIAGLTGLMMIRRNRFMYADNTNSQFLKASYKQLQGEIAAGIWDKKDAQKYEQDLLKQILKLDETPRILTDYPKKRALILGISTLIFMLIGANYLYLSLGRPDLAPITRVEQADYYFNQSVGALHQGLYDLSLHNLDKLQAIEGESAEITMLKLENMMASQQWATARALIDKSLNLYRQDFSFQLTLLRHLLALKPTKIEAQTQAKHVLSLLPANGNNADLAQKLQEIIAQ